jgi:uncharacterized repeat protein (TIGR03803 family)
MAEVFRKLCGKPKHTLHKIRIAHFFFFLLFLFNGASAQDKLFGLNMIGGPNNGGVAYSLLGTGADFKVLRGFQNLGGAPRGTLCKAADGNYYGTTAQEGLRDGTIYRMTPAGKVSVIHHFTSSTGQEPLGGLVLGPDKNLYGMTWEGGTNFMGTIFRVTTSGVYTLLYRFSQTSGYNPYGTLAVGSDGYLYGMARYGGTKNAGTIFRITTSGTGFSVLHNFRDPNAFDGADPLGDLVEGADGSYYGMTSSAARLPLSTVNHGNIFKITKTGVYTVLYNFNQNPAATGNRPKGSLIRGSNGNFYGMTSENGPGGGGTIFSLNSTGGGFQVLASFILPSTGGIPNGKLFDGQDGYLYGTTTKGGSSDAGTIFKVSLSTKSISVLRHLSFTTTGALPFGTFIKHSDGYLYGTASYGASKFYYPNTGFTNSTGTIFKIHPSGSTFAIVQQFPDSAMGIYPSKSWIRAADGNMYGTTQVGGKYGAGVLFKLSTSGSYSKMNSFNGTTDGGVPGNGMIQGKDGSFYGCTRDGGSAKKGTIYKMTSTGVITVLYNFTSTSGSMPEGKLMQASDGSFYGTTSRDGNGAAGTIFKFTLPSTFVVLRHLIKATDGSSPVSALVQNGPGGTIFGATSDGGAYGGGVVFKIVGSTFTIVRTLSSTSSVSGNLIIASNGVLYGVSSSGGVNGAGYVFRITPSTGVYRVVYEFVGGNTGKTPYAGLVEGSSQITYGTTGSGGVNNLGVIYQLSLSGVFKVIKHLDGTTGRSSRGELVVVKGVSAITSNSVLEAEDINASKPASIYPNPVRGTLVLESNELEEDFVIQILNSSGQLIRQSSNNKRIGNNQVQLDVGDLQPGSYILTLKSKSKSHSFNFVKH